MEWVAYFVADLMYVIARNDSWNWAICLIQLLGKAIHAAVSHTFQLLSDTCQQLVKELTFSFTFLGSWDSDETWSASPCMLSTFFVRISLLNRARPSRFSSALFSWFSCGIMVIFMLKEQSRGKVPYILHYATLLSCLCRIRDTRTVTSEIHSIWPVGVKSITQAGRLLGPQTRLQSIVGFEARCDPFRDPAAWECCETVRWYSVFKKWRYQAFATVCCRQMCGGLSAKLPFLQPGCSWLSRLLVRNNIAKTVNKGPHSR